VLKPGVLVRFRNGSGDRSVKVLKSTLVTFWTAVSSVLGTLVVLSGVSTPSIRWFATLCMIGFAIALRIIAHGRAAVPVSRLLHDRES
jgi:uncharacterized membrane protein YphA (DoxX/SURF4 family)